MRHGARRHREYDAEAKRWRADPGDFELYVGRSSAQIELRGKVALAANEAAAVR